MTDTVHVGDLKQHLSQILAGLPSEWGDGARQEVAALVEVGEFGLALETLALVSLEDGLPVPAVSLKLIDLVATRMGLREYEAIRRLHDDQKIGA